MSELDYWSGRLSQGAISRREFIGQSRCSRRFERPQFQPCWRAPPRPQLTRQKAAGC